MARVPRAPRRPASQRLRERAEAALRRSEELYHSLTGLVSDFYWEQDAQHRFTSVVAHPSARGLPDLFEAQMIGKARWEIAYLNMGPADWQAHRAALEARQTFHDLDLARLGANGVPVWLRVSGHPVFDPRGRFVGYRGVARDITGRMRADQLQQLEHEVAAALARAREPLAAIVPVLQAICERDGWECARYFEVHEPSAVMRFAAAWGVNDAAIVLFIERSRDLVFTRGNGVAGLAWATGAPAASRDIVEDERAVRRDSALAAGVRGTFAFPVVSAGQCIGVITLSSRAHREADEMVLRAASSIGSQLGQFVHRARAEEALRQSEERFRSLTELSSDWYWEQDRDLRFTGVSGRAIQLDPTYGVKRWELPGAEAADWDAHRAALEAHLPFRDFHYSSLNAKGERHYYSISGQPLFDDHGIFAGYRGTGRDITAQKRIEEELQRFRASMDMSGDMILIVERASMRFVDANSTACRLLGYTREELLAMGPYELMREPRDELERSIDLRIRSAAGVSQRRGQYFCKDGSTLPFEATRGLLHSGQQTLLVVISRDIRERIAVEQEQRQAGERIRNQARQQRLIAELGRQALGNVDLNDLLNRAVRLLASTLATAVCDMLELDAQAGMLTIKACAGRGAEWIGRRIAVAPGLLAAYQLSRSEPLIVEDFAEERRFDATPLREQGWASGLQVPIHGPEGLLGLLGTFSRERRRFTEDDVSFLGAVANILSVAIERKSAEDRLAYLAQFDSLTGLPNRHLFHDRLAQALAQAKRNTALMAVLFIDLDRFKLVNDTLGHAIGDRLLKEAATRLQECVRTSDTVGRLGGDEFSAILPELGRPGDASLVAQKIIDALGRPFLIDQHETYVSASVGITVFPDDGDAAGVLIMNADAAMYRAKEQGRNNFQYFTREMNERALSRVNLEAQLRRAIDRSEFRVVYQPRVDLATGSICGFEALLRWKHPERGVIHPVEFIPVLEDTGLIVPVGEWVLAEACRIMGVWQAAGSSLLPIAVNLSARQFQQKDLESAVRRIVASTGADASMLQFEITESLLMGDPEGAARILRGLRDSGVKISIDDFGTGYSSLAYLKRFPLDALKIDRAFVRDIATDPEDAAIALAIINLAHTLELRVVAEGVETEAQLDFLASHGCDEMQGFYFSRPVEASVCEAMLRQGLRLARGAAQLAFTPRAA